MTWALDSIVIKDDDLTVRTYSAADAGPIARAIHDPDGWYGRNWGFDSVDKVQALIETLLGEHEKGSLNPIVYELGGEVAGITRFMRLDPRAKTLEIGGTWVAPKHQRGPVNTRVKRLLLSRAFEELGAQRVEFRVDARNYASQIAVLRLGAKFEGKLRHRQIYPDGRVVDGHLYSVIEPEWRATRARLDDLIHRRPLAEPLDCAIESTSLSIAPYTLDDAQALFALIERNRSDLIESFKRTSKIASSEDAQAAIALYRHLAAAREAYHFVVKSNCTPVGQLQIKNVDWNLMAAELGYFVDRDYRRRGIASDSISAALHLLSRIGFRRVFLRTVPSNIASQSLALALGFELEGVQRSGFMTGHGARSDVHFYSKVDA